MKRSTKILLIILVTSVFASIAVRAQADDHGKQLTTRAMYDEQGISSFVGFYPWWEHGLEEAGDSITWAVPVGVETNEDSVWTNPNVEISLNEKLLTLGTSIMTGADFLSTEEGDEVEFFVEQRFWLGISYYDEDFLIRVQPSYILDYVNWPEQSTDIYGEVALRHREDDSWKLQVGTDGRWIYTTNDEFERNQIAWDVTFQLAFLGDLRPSFTLEHRTLWDVLMSDDDAYQPYDRMMDRLFRGKVGISPGNFSIFIFGDVVLDEPDIEEPWSIGAQISINLE
jgi:hypothetical protein